MLNVVKKTRKCGVFDLLCPHRCRGCGHLGEVLCECCKNDITSEYLNRCPKCLEVINYRCSKCNLPFFMTFVMGKRSELLGQMAEEYKYYSVRAMADKIAEMVDECLPDMEGEIVIVPLPTIAKHIRERGFDHTFEVAKRIAKRRGWKVMRVIERKNNTVQVGANAKQRKEQAKNAYKVNEKVKISENATYILYDDVWTTGSSMLEGEKVLREAGAKNIAALVLARSGE